MSEVDLKNRKKKKKKKKKSSSKKPAVYNYFDTAGLSDDESMGVLNDDTDNDTDKNKKSQRKKNKNTKTKQFDAGKLEIAESPKASSLSSASLSSSDNDGDDDLLGADNLLSFDVTSVTTCNTSEQLREPPLYQSSVNSNIMEMFPMQQSETPTSHLSRNAVAISLLPSPKSQVEQDSMDMRPLNPLSGTANYAPMVMPLSPTTMQLPMNTAVVGGQHIPSSIASFQPPPPPSQQQQHRRESSLLCERTTEKKTNGDEQSLEHRMANLTALDDLSSSFSSSSSSLSSSSLSSSSSLAPTMAPSSSMCGAQAEWSSAKVSASKQRKSVPGIDPPSAEDAFADLADLNIKI